MSLPYRTVTAHVPGCPQKCTIITLVDRGRVDVLNLQCEHELIRSHRNHASFARNISLSVSIITKVSSSKRQTMNVRGYYKLF